MAELKEVIYSIERCICHVPDACKDCSKYGGDNVIRCMEELLTDALSLLKAQEPEKPIYKQIVNEYEKYTEYINRSFCAKCGAEFIHRVNYCPRCGKAVKWE